MGKKRAAKKAKRRRLQTELILEELRPTPEDWYPNWPGDKVRIRAIWDPNRNVGLLSAWGADDSGMERFFDEKEELERVAQLVPKVVTRKDLLELGLVPA